VDNYADFGEILHPEPTTIAGVRIDLNGLRFRLLRCKSCDFSYKWPRIPEDRLLECYAKVHASHWQVQGDGRERRFDQIAALLKRYSPGNRVLDVGCFAGSFLTFLGHDWQWFGVEPSIEAAHFATRSGITLLGATLADIEKGTVTFDAIVAIDVVEHVADPLSFFRTASDMLSPGGVLIIFTGNADARSWRLHKNMYWYCSLPEHISFYSSGAFDYISRHCGLLAVEHLTMSHNRWSLRDRAGQAIKNLGYAAINRVGGLGIPALRRHFVERRAPTWMAASDHILCAMKRKESAATASLPYLSPDESAS
jgi:SAM-dependent methyltransferase